MRLTIAFAAAALALSATPRVARADIWFNLIGVKARSVAGLPKDGCELMSENKTTGTSVVRCSGRSDWMYLGLSYMEGKSERVCTVRYMTSGLFSKRWEAAIHKLATSSDCFIRWANDNTVEVRPGKGP